MLRRQNQLNLIKCLPGWKGKTRCSEKRIKDANSGGSHLFLKHFLFPLLWYLHLKLRVEQIRNWPQASTNCSLLKKKNKTKQVHEKPRKYRGEAVPKSTEQRLEGLLIFPEIPTGVMTQQSVAISCRKEQSNSWNARKGARSRVFSAIYQNSSAPWECLATYVPLKNEVANQGVIAMTCEEQDL